MFLLCLALLLPATISRAADATNSPAPASSQKSPADIEGSAEWVRKAFQQSNAWAVVNLASKYHTGDGVPKDDKKAIQLFFSAAAVGDNNGARNVGVSYLEGFGVPKDYAKGMDWLKAAAADGDKVAKFNIGKIYSSELDGSRDDTKAFVYFASSASQGYARAEAKLGGFTKKASELNAIWSNL